MFFAIVFFLQARAQRARRGGCKCKREAQREGVSSSCFLAREVDGGGRDHFSFDRKTLREASRAPFLKFRRLYLSCTLAHGNRTLSLAQPRIRSSLFLHPLTTTAAKEKDALSNRRGVAPPQRSSRPRHRLAYAPRRRAPAPPVGQDVQQRDYRGRRTRSDAPNFVYESSSGRR